MNTTTINAEEARLIFHLLKNTVHEVSGINEDELALYRKVKSLLPENYFGMIQDFEAFCNEYMQNFG